MIKKQLLRYIVPNIFAMLGISFYVLADTFFISLYEGADGITALNLVLPVYGVIYAIGAMIGIGSATRYSLTKPIDKKQSEYFFPNAVIWSVIFSLIFVLAGVFFSENILEIMGADSSIKRIGTPYLRTVLTFTPFFMLNYSFTAFVRNDGSPNTAMAATISSSLFNVLFDYILMFPLGMGMTGAALATGISPIVSIAICLSHFFSKNNSVKFKFVVPSFSKLINACILGVTAFVGEISGAVTTLVFNFIILGIAGNTGVAAYGVIANTALVGTAVFNGVSQGLQPPVSEAQAKGREKDKKKIYLYSLLLSLFISAAIITLVMLYADVITDIFNSDNSESMFNYSVSGLKLYFLGFLPASVNIITAGFFSAAGMGRESSVLSLSRGIFAITFFAFILSEVLGLTGVWLSFLASETVTLLLVIFIFFINRKQHCSEK